MKMICRIILKLIATVFLVSGIIKIYDFDNTLEYFTTIFSLNFYLLKYGLILLIFIELVLGYILAFSKNFIEAALYSTMLLISGFLIINVFLLTEGVANCGCFGTVTTNNPTLSLIKNLFMVLGAYYVIKSNKTFFNEKGFIK